MSSWLDDAREAWRVIRLFMDGFLLLCPRCHAGKMFNGLRMYDICPICDLPFEMGAGEVTGGMGINAVASFAVVIIVAVLVITPNIPTTLAIGLVAFAGIAFPIAFYRSSRGLWVSFLYWSGNNEESDIHEPTE
jgi:uncharacterized protein (DUF983 family)